MKKQLMMIGAAAFAAGANAASITIDSVVQRWPWNNKVDITYTVTDGQYRAAGVYYGLRFALTADGRTYEFDGASIGASAESGDGSRQHTVTWTAPRGIVSSSCSLTATLFPTNEWASGNDYMIVDLATGAITYEGLLKTQEESNERYTNNVAYKTTHMVLRKVPKWADRDTLPNAADFEGVDGYPTGHEDYTSTTLKNTPKRWPIDRDFYIGIFPVTQKQYENMCGSNPSNFKTDATGNSALYRPVEQVSWYDLRTGSSTSRIAATSPIPAVTAFEGTFFQRLNYRTGLYFDLPTEVMFEIAMRAGATTKYYWGDDVNTDYLVCYEHLGNGKTMEVGSCLPNNWGLFDMVGNTWEWCLDENVSSSDDMASRLDAFTPGVNEKSNYRMRRGSNYSIKASTSSSFKASYRNNEGVAGDGQKTYGFRVALVVK